MKTSISISMLLSSMMVFSSTTPAQITFSSAFYNAVYKVGNPVENYFSASITTANIGSPGGGNKWNFNGITATDSSTSTGVVPSSTPYISDFPNSNVTTYSKIIQPSSTTQNWSYYRLNPQAISLYGEAFLVTTDTSTDISKLIYDTSNVQLSLPFTFNSRWGSAFNVKNTKMHNGADRGTTINPIVDSVYVDAYGTLTMPNGVVLDALRLRRVINSYRPNGTSIKNISYSFQTLGGYSVNITATDTTALTSGVIKVQGIGWGVTDINGAIAINKPLSGEVVLAGSSYKITWNAPAITSPLRIDFSSDNGKTYKTIANNVTASNNTYTWNVPDIVAAKCMIKIVDINDTTKTGTAGLFRIKGYVLTRIDANGDYEKFEQGKHGWRFINDSSAMWRNSWWAQFNYTTGIDPNTNAAYPAYFYGTPSSNFPDWPLWVKVFSPAQCYVGPSGIYKGKAELKWKVKSSSTFHGACFGFAATSFMAFSFQNQFLAAYPGISEITNLYDVLMSDAVRAAINGGYLFQFGKQSLDNDIIGRPKDPRTTLQDLKDMFLSDDPDIKTVTIFNNSGAGGGAHTMAPVKLVVDTFSDGFYNLYLYNSNHPGDSTGCIQIDSMANTWYDATGLGSTWKGNSHFYLELPVSNYFNTPIFRKTAPGFIPKTTAATNIEFYNSPDANVLYTSSGGKRIGVKDSVIVNEIGNGIPIFNKTGYPSNPIGFYIPDDSYSMVLTNAHGAAKKIYFTAFKDNVIYDYERDSATSTQTDRFKIDNGFSVVSPDAANKFINLEVIAEADTLERIMFVRNTQLMQNDSLYLQQVNQSAFVIKNYGNAKNYDLEIDDRSVRGQHVFQYPSVLLKANSTQTLVPDWGNLDRSTLRILIDTGNKGSNNDSLILSNRSTGINDHDVANTPNSYSLAQNYPNPFNPTTTIRYQLQAAGKVTLKVYDILGKEVAVLVNEEQAAGTYSVTFDAGSLSGGIYFYRLQAGTFVETRKLVLVK
jgi:hypothetical protein